MKNYLGKIVLVTSICMLFFSACNNEEVEYAVNNTTVSMYVKDSVALSLSPVKAGWVFSSDNSNVASVSPKGIITGKHVGKAVISVCDTLSGFTAQVNVTINTRISLYSEPCLTFYVDESTIRNYETRTFLYRGDGNDHYSSYLRYQANNSYHDEFVYYFDLNGKYYEAEVIVSDFFKKEFDEYLNDRCMTTSNENHKSYSAYITPDSSMRVYTQNYLERTIVLYTAGDYKGDLWYITWGY